MAGLMIASLAGCVSTVLDVEQKAVQPIPAAVLATMKTKGMSPKSPVLVRIFKQESEFEVWKQDHTGRFALLKTYPMCRWSGKLGPKMKSGDRQAPEGFYHVNAGMLNPASQYYLSFNLGYPNRLESALGYSGEALMVHGACSSSGCYALTDEGIGEIYSIVREALRGGQSSFQVQAFPFRMTAANMAANRNDRSFAFWQTLKTGYDAFEVTRRQPKVSYCERRYVFDAQFASEPTDPLAACPPIAGAENPAVAMRAERDRSEMERLLAEGTAPTAYAYQDGGMHPSFRKVLQRNGEKALAKQTSLTKVPISRPAAVLGN
ncbi:MAG: hypothetical protein AB7S80_04575 [Rhizobiaceae bacterium]